MNNGLRIRHTEPADIPQVIALSARVQQQLADSGSLQQIGPLAPDTLHDMIRGGNAYVVEMHDTLVGSVFLEPLSFSQYTVWKLTSIDRRFWFVSRLMLDPKYRGRRMGEQVVRELQR
ncbi:MAG: hypothetical protein KC547_05280, partial [Anaerolineae bacterium]|nr:hypothetical protein [Anaerolineae bacterium]